MLEAVKLPASVADLDTGLTDVDRNALPHFRKFRGKKLEKGNRSEIESEEGEEPESYTKTSLG